MFDTFLHFLWSTVVIFAFIAYLMILFNILIDLFSRDPKNARSAIPPPRTIR